MSKADRKNNNSCLKSMYSLDQHKTCKGFMTSFEYALLLKVNRSTYYFLFIIILTEKKLRKASMAHVSLFECNLCF